MVISGAHFSYNLKARIWCILVQTLFDWCHF